MATKTKTVGFDLRCPQCGESGTALTVDLNELGDVSCGGCGETYAVAEAIALIEAELAKWRAVAKWLEMAETIAAGDD